MTNANENSQTCVILQNEFLKFYVLCNRKKKKTKTKKKLTKPKDAEIVDQLNDGSQQLRQSSLAESSRILKGEVLYKCYKKKKMSMTLVCLLEQENDNMKKLNIKAS